MKKRVYLNNPVARALLVKAWKTDAVVGQIRAITGQDGVLLVKGAGRIIFVVLGAAIECNLDHDLPDLRIVRGAANALGQVVKGTDGVDEVQRQAVLSGLNACQRLLELVTQKALANAAIDMELRALAGELDLQAMRERVEALEA